MKQYLSSLIFVLLFTAPAFANSLLLQDVNLDGSIEMLAFGDSITRGVGDTYNPGAEITEILPTPEGEAGYPLRLENWLKVPVSNRGVRGEFMTDGGVFRFASTIAASNADYVIISEGANDTFLLATANLVRRDLQAMINMTRAMGKEPILMTIPGACCNRYGSRLFIDSYNSQYRDLAAINNVTLSDVNKSFTYVCPGDGEGCRLFNLPEGLHPNRLGYDAVAQGIIASLYGIDLLSPGGDAELSQALGLPQESIVVKSPASQ